MYVSRAGLAAYRYKTQLTSKTVQYRQHVSFSGNVNLHQKPIESFQKHKVNVVFCLCEPGRFLTAFHSHL